VYLKEGSYISKTPSDIFEEKTLQGRKFIEENSDWIYVKEVPMTLCLTDAGVSSGIAFEATLGFITLIGFTSRRYL